MDSQRWPNPYVVRARDILAANLQVLKRSTPGLGTQQAIQARARARGDSISQSTISRALKGTVALDLDTLDVLARVFGRQPADLLLPIEQSKRKAA
jgi:hypothetical protein